MVHFARSEGLLAETLAELSAGSAGDGTGYCEHMILLQAPMTPYKSSRTPAHDTVSHFFIAVWMLRLSVCAFMHHVNGCSGWIADSLYGVILSMTMSRNGTDSGMLMNRMGFCADEEYARMQRGCIDDITQRTSHALENVFTYVQQRIPLIRCLTEHVPQEHLRLCSHYRVPPPHDAMRD